MRIYLSISIYSSIYLSAQSSVPAVADQVLGHGDAVRELASVPGKILLAVGVLDVQPHHVHRDVVLIELGAREKID